MAIQLKVKNFRCLRNVDWSPDGVCVLVGPNGAGKSTLFDALNFLRLAVEVSLGQAVAATGGEFFCNLDAPRQESVDFTMIVQKNPWNLSITFGSGPFDFLFREEFQHNSQPAVRNGNQNAASIIRELAGHPEQDRDACVNAIITTVGGCHTYGSYVLPQLRNNGSPHTPELQLAPNGANAFAVLRNWRDKRDYRAAYNFVIGQLAEAFPGVAGELEFESAAQITSIRLYNSHHTKAIPVAFAPNGWLAGLLHLMAVAGANPGGVVMIDEFENSLHPYAIRILVRAMREWAAKRDLTVILAGHSPALLDEFKDDPSRVFVMEPWRPGQPAMPLRLTDYRDPEWLKHFSLGELYRHEDFGGPLESTANAAPVLSAS